MEIIIVLAIIGVSMFVVRVVVNLLDGFFQSSATTEAQRDVQSTLYNITKDIRNCQEIVDASGSRLQLKMYNTKPGYRVMDQNTTLFNPNTYLTLTYEYEKVGNESYLKRTLTYPPTTTTPPDVKKLLRNILVEPTPADYLFMACTPAEFALGGRCTPGTASAPFNAVDIRLSVSPLYVRHSASSYVSRVMRRSQR